MIFRIEVLNQTINIFQGISLCYNLNSLKFKTWDIETLIISNKLTFIHDEIYHLLNVFDIAKQGSSNGDIAKGDVSMVYRLQ